MNRRAIEALKTGSHFLYARGDEPNVTKISVLHSQFSLRTWRWTDAGHDYSDNNKIFSTHVEMNRVNRTRREYIENFLYARGDEPLLLPFLFFFKEFSLRTWRWTADRKWNRHIATIFSTHVEMNRFDRIFLARRINFLYARGDEPESGYNERNHPLFSLRTWRWTEYNTAANLSVCIFSTHVEMNRRKRQSDWAG